MARSLWKGAITFGLVNIPVELFSAEERKGFQFSMLDKRDFRRSGTSATARRAARKWSGPTSSRATSTRRTSTSSCRTRISGAPTSRPRGRSTSRLSCPSREIPAQYYETPYYLAPADRGEKVYALLRETLRATGRVAVGAGRHPHDPAPGRGRPLGACADADHDALCRRAARRAAASSCRRKV